VTIRSLAAHGLAAAALAAAVSTASSPAGAQAQPKPVPADAKSGSARGSAASERAVVSADDGASFNLLGEAEVSAYKDDQAVEVLSPAISVGAESSTDGWGVSGSFLVDVVTAASPDIVSTASPRWTETRYVPGLSGHKRIGDVDVSAAGGVSLEPDYTAIAAGVGVSVDLRDKTVTPALRYGFGYDISGRAGTPFSVFSNEIQRHSITGALTLVLDRQTILVPTVDVVLEIGDTSKPYRFLPTFSAATAADLENGAAIEEVNRVRTPVRLDEEVPEDRQRYAVSGLLARRFASFTLRLEERLYVDSWGVMATTTDATLPIDLGDVVRVWPHARFHAQKGADFWERAYVVEPTARGFSAPALRAGDRELGPLLGMTGGGGIRLGGDTMGLVLSADAFYSLFLDHLYASSRIAGFGALGYELILD
jgi:hypothetical protein